MRDQFLSLFSRGRSTSSKCILGSEPIQNSVVHDADCLILTYRSDELRLLLCLVTCERDLLYVFRMVVRTPRARLASQPFEPHVSLARKSLGVGEPLKRGVHDWEFWSRHRDAP